MVGEESNTIFGKTELNTSRSFLKDLLSALQWLDRLLERAVTAAQAVYGPQAMTDPFLRTRESAKCGQLLIIWYRKNNG